MIFRCLEALSVFPPAAAVNIGDTLPDIDSGRNAGTWSVGVVRTGNMLGLGREDIAALDSEELARMTESGRRKMLERGAHYVVDGIEQLPELIETINRRMARGDRP
jgi:phosphonoacetaldehyde hydrolase